MTTAVSALNLTDVKNLIDARLSDYSKVRTLSANQVGERYVLLWSTISTLIEAGGKRLRPFMLIGAFDAYAPEDEIEAILPAALAQELIHLAMLIHDDIIDRDTIRYGIKNVSGQYEDHYAPFIEDTNERAHMTQSSALLAGDVLLSDAFRLLSRSERPAELVTKAITILSNGVFEVVGGELLDTESAFLQSPDINAEVIARYKTASYSFISPLTMGAVLAGASDDQVKLLHEFGETLGIAYQLRDDQLGVFGTAAITGKSTTSDIREGKRTYLIEQFTACATETQKKKFFAIFHNAEATDDDIEKARTILLESGAKARVDEKIAELHQKAKTILAQLTITDDAKATFNDLLELCLTRES